MSQKEITAETLRQTEKCEGKVSMACNFIHLRLEPILRKEWAVQLRKKNERVRQRLKGAMTKWEILLKPQKPVGSLQP